MPSENVATSITAETETVPEDRRGRKRAARREALLEHASQIVANSGVDGLTMAALADAADYATASLYTYFPSRSSLVAALQQRALEVLGGVARDAVNAWDAALAEQSGPKLDPVVASIARLWAFSQLFLTAPQHHPREFMLQQQLLVSPDTEDVSDAAAVVPVAMLVLDVPRGLLHAARRDGALNDAADNTSPLGDLLDIDLLRTFCWVTALNGALLTDGLSTGLPTTGALLGSELTRSLLVGWGGDADLVEQGRELAAEVCVPVVGSKGSVDAERVEGGPR